jgi:hypothetical protein
MSNIQVQLRRGTTAQHGSFTGAQGELTVDTDKNALVLHDGATAGGIQVARDAITATGSTTARSLADRFADVVNVLDYIPNNLHADIKNGTSTTDVSSYIQDAIDDAEITTVGDDTWPEKPYGRTVSIPSGTYIIESGLTIQASGVHLVGQGTQSTILKYQAGSLTTSDYLIKVGIEPSGTNRQYGVQLKGFTLCHDISTDGLSSPRGIKIYDTHNWVVDDVEVFGLHQGFYSEEAWRGIFSNSVVGHNYRSSYLNQQSHDVSIENVFFGDTKEGYDVGAPVSHISVRNSWGVSIRSCNFEDLDVLPTEAFSIYLFNAVRGCEVKNNYFERIEGYALYIRDESAGSNNAVAGLTVENNFFNIGATGKGIRVRHDGTANAKHSGIIVQSNYVRIDPSEYLITETGATTTKVENCFFGQNYFQSGAGEYNNTSALNGWNEVNFQKIDVGNGSVVAQVSSVFSEGANKPGIYFDASGSTPVIVPTDNTGTRINSTVQLGSAAFRWTELFAVNGVINTSDEEQKQDIRDITTAERAVATSLKGMLKAYRWKQAVQEKGENARIHFGIIAQDVAKAFQAQGLDADKYGMFCKDSWVDDQGKEQTTLGVRYNELLTFIISSI